jgi:hypothetical protein
VDLILASIMHCKNLAVDLSWIADYFSKNEDKNLECEK